MTIAIPAKHRWTGYLLAAAAILVAMKWAGGLEGNELQAPAIPAADRLERESGIDGTATAVPVPPFRSYSAHTGNPFSIVRSWEQTAAAHKPVLPPPPPQAPALPFTYLGRLLSGETTTVFLSRKDDNYIARVGDTLDGTYAVEKIEEAKITLIYLPLGVLQTLSFSATGATHAPAQAPARPSPPVRVAAAGASGPASLQLSAPEQVIAGQEFVVQLSLLAAAEASVGLIYDPTVLNVIRRPVAGAATAPDHGHVLVDLVGPGFAGTAAAPAAVRFRVVGAAPTTTQIQVEHLSAMEPFSIPAPHNILVSSAQRAP
ncbi:MAG: hypothetical protein ACRET6_00495 [Burkholderiales bacterium]